MKLMSHGRAAPIQPPMLSVSTLLYENLPPTPYTVACCFFPFFCRVSTLNGSNDAVLFAKVQKNSELGLVQAPGGSLVESGTRLIQCQERERQAGM